MKRRSFGLLTGSALAGLAGIARSGNAEASDASLLTTTLTPFGAERAGNADGSIPAWTGGYRTLPEGYRPGDYIGELFPDEKPVLVIDSSNVAQYADRLSEGAVAMVHDYGFSLQVYPTHRTHSAPQQVYDCIAANAASATLNPAGGRWGFANAFGGVPFPIPDANDPVAAGAQIVWNCNSTWRGYAFSAKYESWSVSNGQPVLAFAANNVQRFPYYQTESLAGYNGILTQLTELYTAPANLVGQNLVVWSYNDPAQHQQAAWQLLNGEGRVRRAPEISFDTPSGEANGIANYDEYFGFNGSLERYDWKYLGKKEMYIPYNNNRLYGATVQEAHLAHFLDPNLVRYELHRCHVVEATLHPGERNVDARRVLYIDEDTYLCGLVDVWDAYGNLVKTNIVYNCVWPGLPGTIHGQNVVHNLQTGDYVSLGGVWNQKAQPGGYIFFGDRDSSLFDPEEMAASAQY